MPPATATVALSDRQDAATSKAVEEGLIGFNHAAAGPNDWRPLVLSVRRAEDEARASGCVGAHLDTFSFQARGFYEKQGYAVFGAIPHCPPGHSRFFLSKRLDAPPPA